MPEPDERSFESALQTVRASALDLPAEEVALGHLAGRRLAAEVRALHDLPGIDCSAMDGFAVRAGDCPGELSVVGESRAGAPFLDRLGSAQAVAISTGARVPDGADAVVPVERVERSMGRVGVGSGVAPESFVRRAGGDRAAGELVMARGAVVEAHMVAAIAAAGHGAATVERRARVGILTAGDELVEPGTSRAPEQVIDAARPGIAAQARSVGARVAANLRVPDRTSDTDEAVAALLDGAEVDPVDLLVTVGGVSVGAHDHVRAAFEAAAVERVFWGVSLKPGHPLWFGVKGEQRVLGLPGNPVSAAVCFHVFGRAVLGRDGDWQRRAPLAEAFGTTIPRTQLVRCRWRDGALEPLRQQESHEVTSLAHAQALALVPPNSSELPAGSVVRYQPL